MNEKIKLLYVEDDITLSFVTRDNLQLYGYTIDYCEDGIEGLKLFNENKYDLCILDVMLPRMDGYELALKIRKKNKEIPIIFLTAKSRHEDKIHGLRIGADDYITKPFSIEELVLKIEVFLRRSGIRKNADELTGECKLGKFVFDIGNHILTGVDGKKQLTHREAQLLAAFCRNSDTIIKRDDLLIKIWGDDHYFASRSLDVFISRLRKYLKSDPALKIENIHNVGYRLITRPDNTEKPAE
jgi:two-component system, OmpR family, response regulator VicR